MPKTAILLAIALATSTVALAQLPLPLPIPLPLPLPQGTPEDRAACEPDVQRYCKGAVPDQLRVLNCLQDNRRRISQSCQGVLARYGQ